MSDTTIFMNNLKNNQDVPNRGVLFERGGSIFHDKPEIDSRLAELEEKAFSISLRSARRALWCNFASIVTQMLIVAMGMTISILNIGGPTISRKTIMYITGILGICVVTVEGLRSSFKFGKRGINYKKISTNSSLISRKARTLSTKRNMTFDQKEIKIDEYYRALSQLELSLYSNNIINTTSAEGFSRKFSATYSGVTGAQVTGDVPIGRGVRVPLSTEQTK